MTKTQSPVVAEAKRLHDLGFAVIWLHPKSKRPIESGWTKGPRSEWKYLKETFIEGLNVGVRTGSPSKLQKGGFLACIDVDVKDPAFRDAALSKLKELIGDRLLPEVRSGGGNGSRHLYCVTEKPFKMMTIAKVPDKWEICVYSDGRQMVLPPSIHPSGRAYSWKTGTGRGFPVMDFAQFASDAGGESKGIANVVEDFELSDVELSWLPISQQVKDGIIEGKGVTDRSAYLLIAANALVSAGLSKNEILTVLTEKNYFLGRCAFDHAQTESRKKAALWLWNYTVKRVLNERNPETAFKGKAVVEKELSESEASEQSEELSADIFRPEDNGFYDIGKNGAKNPNYNSLLRAFEAEHPYKMIADMKAIYVFNGTHYQDCSPFEVKAFAERMFSPKPTEKIRTEFLNKVHANNVDRRSFFFSTTEGKVNFKNGVMDLSGFGGLEPHSPDFGFRGVLPYDYDPGARCPFFWKWINGIMLGDRELVAILQEYMGYIIRGGEYHWHKALWLEGTGRNGKSTFIDVLKALIGHGNYTTISIKSFVTDKFAGAELDGKIANFSEETSPQELADSGPFKNLTGDGDMFVQKKFGDPYCLRNRAKLVMSYNTIPDLKDLSPGMISRPLIVPFRKQISEAEQDHKIKEKLFAELPGIFNFALRGWERLEGQNTFTKSGHSELALQKIKEESCNAYQWVENYVDFVPNEGLKIHAREMYASYRAREKYPYSLVHFCRRINAHPKMQERRSRKADERYYWGVKLR